MSIIELLKAIASGENQMTKSSAAIEVFDLKNQILEGEINPLPIFAAAEYLAAMLESLTKDEAVREVALKELERYGKNDHFSFNGVKVEASDYSRYDYSNTEKRVKIQEKIDLYRNSQKEVEAMAKNLRQSLTEVDEETGEIHRIFPPIKKTSTTIKITIPK